MKKREISIIILKKTNRLISLKVPSNKAPAVPFRNQCRIKASRSSLFRWYIRYSGTMSIEHVTQI